MSVTEGRAPSDIHSDSLQMIFARDNFVSFIVEVERAQRNGTDLVDFLSKRRNNKYMYNTWIHGNRGAAKIFVRGGPGSDFFNILKISVYQYCSFMHVIIIVNS